MTFSRPSRLTKVDRIDGFSCGEPALDDWLERHAIAANGGGSATVWVTLELERVIGYYALSMSSIERAATPARAAAGMPDPVPSVLLARFAIDQSAQGRGLGRSLMRDVFLRSVTAAESVGAQVLLVHAKSPSARTFYARWPFMASPTDPMHLCMLLKDIRASIEAARDE